MVKAHELCPRFQIKEPFFIESVIFQYGIAVFRINIFYVIASGSNDDFSFWRNKRSETAVFHKGTVGSHRIDNIVFAVDDDFAVPVYETSFGVMR